MTVIVGLAGLLMIGSYFLLTLGNDAWSFLNIIYLRIYLGFKFIYEGLRLIFKDLNIIFKKQFPNANLKLHKVSAFINKIKKHKGNKIVDEEILKYLQK